MTNKNGQMKMMETILILIVFFILLFVGIAIYSGYKEKQYKVQERLLQEEVAIELATALSYVPEISCNENLCIDCQGGFEYLKLKVFSNKFPGREGNGVINKNLIYYTPIFGASNISVRIFGDVTGIVSVSDFDITTGGINVNIYDNTPMIWSSQKVFLKPVTVYNPLTETCNYAILNISVYS